MSFSIDTTSHRSPNLDRRGDGTPVLHTPLGILIHSSEGTQASDIPTLTNPHTGDPRVGTARDPRVSSNYYINRAGRIYQLVPDTYRSWHAGPGIWDGLYDWNLAIGIELEHKRGQGSYPAAQLAACEWLCRSKIAQWHIPLSRIAAHRWVAPRRKQDPTDWPDDALRAWIGHLYTLPIGETTYRVILDGTRVREGAGVSFPIARFGTGGPQILLPRDFTFVSDGERLGEMVAGSTRWIHVAQPAPWGFVHSSLVEPL